MNVVKLILSCLLLTCFYNAKAQHSKGEGNFDKNWLFTRYGLQANGDPTCLITFSNPVRPAFNGLLLAIIKAKPGAKGNLELTAESGGLKSDNVKLQIE